MTSNVLWESQRSFAAALLDPEIAIPQGLVGPDGRGCETRFNVYRNNVVVGLVDALKGTFPAVCRIVGDAFFVAMARLYVALEPPQSPVMLDYGSTFPGFIATFEPAASVPYLADVARLELAWVRAYHAPEAIPADPAHLGEIEPRTLPQLVFALHPTVRVVRSHFPAVRIWLMNLDSGTPAPIDIDGGGEDALVVRPLVDVEVRYLRHGMATFVERLAAGASISEAAVHALATCTEFDLTGALKELFEMQAIAGWHVPGTTRHTFPVVRPL